MGDRGNMNDPGAKRRWLFQAEDFDDHSFYLDASGNEVSYDMPDFLGTATEAETEGDRRADLWETANNGCLGRITSESRGKVE